MKRSAKLTLLAIALVSTLPVVASYLAFYVWPPQGTVNYGQLLSPNALPDGRLAGLAGQPVLERTALNGRWTLVYAGPGQCAAACEQALYAMRQSRLAQGKEMGRVERLWLVTDDQVPSVEVVVRHDSPRVARAEATWLAKLPRVDERGAIFLVDPLGNVMMRFPDDPDIKLVIKDLQRLLKYSGLG